VGELIVLFMFLIGLAVFIVIFWSLSQRRQPDDDWAPIEAAFGRKFLGQTARSRRRWVRDRAGRERLIEATKQDVGYVLMIDGEQVGFALPADLNAALDRLEHKISEGQAQA
jgi:hypothetical protein